LFIIPIFVAVVNDPIFPGRQIQAVGCSNPDSKGKPQLLVAENDHLSGKNKKKMIESNPIFLV